MNNTPRATYSLSCIYRSQSLETCYQCQCI